MTSFSPVAQIGSLTLWQRQPEIPPAVLFGCAVSLGAQNLQAYRSMRITRRNCSGVMVMEEQPYTVHLEAYGPTREECERAVARYLERHPWASWRTRFEQPHEIDGELVARGERNAIGGWW